MTTFWFLIPDIPLLQGSDMNIAQPDFTIFTLSKSVSLNWYELLEHSLIFWKLQLEPFLFKGIYDSIVVMRSFYLRDDLSSPFAA